jgi:hypothetical protein
MAGGLKYSGPDDSGSGQRSSSYRQKNGWQAGLKYSGPDGSGSGSNTQRKSSVYRPLGFSSQTDTIHILDSPLPLPPTSTNRVGVKGDLFLL